MHDLISRQKPTPRVHVDIPHAPDCRGKDDKIPNRDDAPCLGWCYIHNQCEPLRPTDYRVCGECFHVFRTEAELIRSHLLVLQSLGKHHYPHELDDHGRLPKILTYKSTIKGIEIYTCPHCAHDF